MSNIYVNHVLADADTKIYENFTVEIAEEGIANVIENDVEDETEKETIVVLVNRQPVTLSEKSSYVYIDVFDKIDFDRSMQKGRTIITKLNGRPAQYMEPIHDGDAIEIYWQEN